jgi:hypothetical protein
MTIQRIGLLLACLVAAALLSGCAGSATPTPVQSEPAAAVRCLFAGTGATLAFDGKRLNFTCQQEGESEIGLLGDIVLADVGWTIEKATIGHSDAGFSLLSSEMVLVEYVELSDGTLCAFAGTGATLAFEGKRLNFTCGSPEVGLLGDVMLADKGWVIEKGVIEHGESGFRLVSSEQVPIVALSVVPVTGG